MSGAVFLWGKLPTHGDFVCRGLDGERRDALDQWLSSGLQQARAALGEAFEPLYDEAPPWRFRWREDAGWAAGCMIPSMDSVGRRYPLLLGRRIADGEGEGAEPALCEEAIYLAFELGWDADDLVGWIAGAALEPPQDDDPGPAEGWWTLGGDHYPPRMLDAPRPPNLWTDILARTPGADA